MSRSSRSSESPVQAKREELRVSAERERESTQRAAAKKADKADAEELEHAPTNGENMESGFGNVDYAGSCIQSRLTTVIGVAHAQKLGSFLSWEKKPGQLKKQRSPKQMFLADEKYEIEKFMLRCYFFIPKEERRRALRDPPRRFK